MIKAPKDGTPTNLQIKELTHNGVVYNSWELTIFSPSNGNVDVWLHAESKTNTITTSVSGGNGTITAPKKTAKGGETVTFTVDPKEGYEFDFSSIVKKPAGLVITPVKNQQNQYTFTMPNEPVEITGSFKKIEKYKINITGGTAYNTNNKPVTEAAAGEYINIASADYETFDHWVADCTLNQDPIVEGNDFYMPNKDVNITAVFTGAETNHKVTVQNDGNGKASANLTTAKKGDKIALTATPNNGYRFKEWQVISGGVKVTNNEFTMPDGDVTVKAIFEEIPAGAYKVTVLTDGNGSGTATPDSAKKDEKVVLSAAPNNGYRFKEWQVISGGITVTNNEFTMPDGDVTVKAVFEKKTEPVNPQPTAPDITSGANGTYQIGAGKNLSLTFSRALNALTGVYMDGKAVDSSNYTLNANYTAMNIKSSYLDTLPAGKHTLTIRCGDGTSLSTEITVKSKAVSSTTGENNIKTDGKKANTVQTGDTTNISLYLCLLSLSAIAIYIIAYVKKRRYR